MHPVQTFERRSKLRQFLQFKFVLKDGLPSSDRFFCGLLPSFCIRPGMASHQVDVHQKH